MSDTMSAILRREMDLWNIHKDEDIISEAKPILTNVDFPYT